MSSHPSNAPDPAIRLCGVTKTYAIWDDPSARLVSLLRRMLGFGQTNASNRSFTAVHEIDLVIARGECLGIIGRNGAGKSTLLQMIAGTLQPTKGSIEVNGRVAALLELGSGFNPDFTGRENIHLNAAILGLPKPEIAAKFEAIVAYSGIEEFIDRPVRTYSSGMTLRLAVSVCVHVRRVWLTVRPRHSLTIQKPPSLRCDRNSEPQPMATMMSAMCVWVSSGCSASTGTSRAEAVVMATVAEPTATRMNAEINQP